MPTLTPPGRMRTALRERAIAWITRRQPAGVRQVTLDRRCIYILPTRYGYTFAGVLVVMLLGAINYSNSLAFLLTFLLAALGSNAMWHTHRNLLGLRITRLPAEPVFAGETARLAYSVANPGRVPRRGLTLEAPGHPGRDLAVPAHGDTRVTLTIPARRRGILRPGRLRLHTRYPLGLFRAWSWLHLEGDVLVYPRPLPVEDAAGGGAPDKDEARTSRQPGGEFTGLRGYTPGDSPRRVDWKALARTGNLYVKEFHEPRGGRLWLDWDDLLAGDVETRLSMLCHQVLRAHGADLEFGLRLPGIEVAPARGEVHRRRCLEHLARFHSPGREGA
ncbi:DUF58 domain-containing protein [Ectothiorhodospira mobilis]|nr:DUF58 domain-containing protein [Ectothiorhodospira mobilis]